MQKLFQETKSDERAVMMALKFRETCPAANASEAGLSREDRALSGSEDRRKPEFRAHGK